MNVGCPSPSSSLLVGLVCFYRTKSWYRKYSDGRIGQTPYCLPNYSGRVPLGASSGINTAIDVGVPDITGSMTYIAAPENGYFATSLYAAVVLVRKRFLANRFIRQVAQSLQKLSLVKLFSRQAKAIAFTAQAPQYNRPL